MFIKKLTFTLYIIIIVIFHTGKSFSQGSILIMGGGNDRKSWADTPFRWFIDKADSGKIINIDVDEVATSYAETFISLGADSSSTSLRIRTTSQANDSSIYNQLLSAKGIWIEGGDQYDYVSTWNGTLTEEAIETIFKQGGVVGGTSAGCAVLGMVDFDARYGTSYPEQAAYNPYHTDVHMSDDFLALIPNVITDSHFHSRGRLGRLVPMLARQIQDNKRENIMGVGVSDNTALCIEADSTAVCYGEGTVTILYKTYDSDINCTVNTPVHFTHLAFDQLIHGTRYNLRTRSLIEPGNGLLPISDTLAASIYRDVLLPGSEPTTADSGEIVITGMTGYDLNAWYGNLDQRQGKKAVPHSVIIPLLWQNSDYFENRWIGGMYGAVTHPGFTTFYLDEDTEVKITESGWIYITGLAYLLETHYATHVGFATNRNSNYPGIIGGILHFLSNGDSLLLSGPETHIQENHSLNSIPHSIKLLPAFPNPFNSSTSLRYFLKRSGFTRLEVLNIKGELVDNLVERYQDPGKYTEKWNPDRITSGIYYVRLQQSGQTVIKTCVFLK